jgi:spore coat protein SA
MHLDLKQKQWEKLLKSARNGIIAINSTAIPLAIEKFGSSPKNEWVIINGVDDKLIHSSVEGFEPTQKDSNTFTFINVGRITPIKGLDVLIEAMEIVARDSSQKVRLIIVGSAAVDEGGDLAFEAQLKERAGKIGNDIVQFAGFVPNDLLVNYYRQADCGVLPTRLMEGNSLFLMECLAMGVPVIATGIGGVPDVVRDGLDGVLIKKGASAKELAKVMIRMVKERTLWRERSEEIRSSAVQRFTYERVAKNLERVVYDVVNTDLK